MTTYLGKSCSFCLPRVPFVNCRQFMYLVISLLVLRAGYGIWLYQFLIIAYLFTLPFLDGDVPRSASCGVYVSQLIRFAGVSGRVVGFGARGGGLTAGLLRRGCRCRRLRETFSGFCRRLCGLVSGFGVGLRALFASGPVGAGVLWWLGVWIQKGCRWGWFFWSVRRGCRSLQACWMWRGYSAMVCVLGVWPSRGWWLCFPLWLHAGGSGVGLNDGPGIGLFVLVGLGRSFFVCCLARRGSAVGFLLLRCSGGVVRRPGDLRVSVATRFCRVLIFASS